MERWGAGIPKQGHGREVVAYLAAADGYLEQLWWEQYESSLTPEEKRLIKLGSYFPLRRRYEPQMEAGAWLKVGPHLRIQVGQKTWVPRRNRWSVPILKVQDFRTPGTPIKTYGEDTESMANTIALGGERPNPPEPHGPDARSLELYAAEAGAKRALGDGERTEARLAEISELPLSRRIIELQKLANERGINVRDEAKAFERRLQRRLERAA